MLPHWHQDQFKGRNIFTILQIYTVSYTQPKDKQGQDKKGILKMRILWQADDNDGGMKVYKMDEVIYLQFISELPILKVISTVWVLFILVDNVQCKVDN